MYMQLFCNFSLQFNAMLNYAFTTKKRKQSLKYSGHTPSELSRCLQTKTDATSKKSDSRIVLLSFVFLLITITGLF